MAVAVTVAEEEKLAEMSLAPGSVTGQSTLGSGAVSYFFNFFTLNQIWNSNVNVKV